MREYVFFALLFVSFFSCSQKKENIKEIKMDITSNNIIDKINEQDLKINGSHQVLKEEKLPVKEIKVGNQEFEKETKFIRKGQKYYEHTFYLMLKYLMKLKVGVKGRT